MIRIFRKHLMSTSTSVRRWQQIWRQLGATFLPDLFRLSSALLESLMAVTPHPKMWDGSLCDNGSATSHRRFDNPGDNRFSRLQPATLRTSQLVWQIGNRRVLQRSYLKTRFPSIFVSTIDRRKSRYLRPRGTCVCRLSTWQKTHQVERNRWMWRNFSLYP